MTINRRRFLSRLAVGASGLVLAEHVRDFMAWEAKRIFALGGVPQTSDAEYIAELFRDMDFKYIAWCEKQAVSNSYAWRVMTSGTTSVAFPLDA